MKGTTVAALGSLAVLAAMVALLAGGKGPAGGGTRLTLYCAAGIQPPVEEVRAEYEREYGVAIDTDYRGSGTLLSSIDVVRRGDLYLAADDSYLELAHEAGLLAERFDLAVMRPVIGVRKGNPKSVHGLRDLLRDDVRVGFANPDAAAIGRIARKLLAEAGIWERLEPRILVMKPTVNTVANDVVIGAIDAAVIWDATAKQFDGVDLVRVGLFEGSPRRVAVGVLTCSRAPAAALRFARFLASRDRGRPRFDAFGFETVEGDLWSPSPGLVLLCGAMLRGAVDRVVAGFERREGLRVRRVYDRGAVLVARITGGTAPDAYFAADRRFVAPVRDRFEPAVTVSEAPLVLVVGKGNPKRVDRVTDLGRTGLRVGLARPGESDLGTLVESLLRREGLWETVEAQVALWSAEGASLVSAVRTGSLDATIVFRSDAAARAGDVDMVAVGARAAFATQQYAIGRVSHYKHTMQRLLDAIAAPPSRRRFEELGFRWKLRAGR